MGKIDFFLFFVPFKHRKVGDPAECQAIGLDHIPVGSQPETDLTHKLTRLLPFARAEEDGIPGLDSQLLDQFLCFPFG